MPWDFETEVRIDCDEVLEYVKDNKDWFLSQLGETRQSIEPEVVSIQRQIQNILDKYDFVRRARDEHHEDSSATKLYEELLSIKELVGNLLKS